MQSWVEEVDFEGTRLKVKGEWNSHDLIIGGDGIKSPIRKQMMARRGEVDQVSKRPAGVPTCWRSLANPDLLVESHRRRLTLEKRRTALSCRVS